jgi:hypothetical protein
MLVGSSTESSTKTGIRLMPVFVPVEFYYTENQPCHPKMMKRVVERKSEAYLEIWILNLRINDESEINMAPFAC